MKITIIGPVYPFKGGMSHHTCLTARDLAAEHEVDVISFKLMYPGLLYKRPQKDYGSAAFKLDDVSYLINTVNPFSAVKTVRHIKKQASELVIFQWWHPYFAPIYRLMLTLLKNKAKTMLLCHNVLPHEKFPFQKMLTKAVLKKADAFIVYSGTDEEDLKNLRKQPVYRKASHPTNNAFATGGISKEAAKKAIGINESDNALLFFGFIREYKGLKRLIRAMPLIHKKYPGTVLLIAGEFFEGTDREEYLRQIKSAGCDDKIKLHDRYIPDEEVGAFFSACDLVICPYEAAKHSGVIQIAYGFHKPVIVTDVGGLPDVVIDNQTGYIIKPCDSNAIAEAVIRFYDDTGKSRFADNIRAHNLKSGWNQHTKIILECYEESVKQGKTNA